MLAARKTLPYVPYFATENLPKTKKVSGKTSLEFKSNFIFLQLFRPPYLLYSHTSFVSFICHA